MRSLSSLVSKSTGRVTAVGAVVALALGGVAAVAMEELTDPEDESDEEADLEEDETDLENGDEGEGEGEADEAADPEAEEEADEAGDEADEEADALVAETDDLADEDGDDERSETARAVHDALTGGEAQPGDPDFGRIVSERAREGGLGREVSAAARGARDADDDNDVDATSGGSAARGGDGPHADSPPGPPPGRGPNR